MTDGETKAESWNINPVSQGNLWLSWEQKAILRTVEPITSEPASSLSVTWVALVLIPVVLGLPLPPLPFI